MEENKKKDRAPLVVLVFLLVALVVCLTLLVSVILNRRKEKQEEVPATVTAVPEATQIPPEKSVYDLAAELTEVDFYVHRYLEDGVYIVKKDGSYGITDLDGNWLAEPEYLKLVYIDQDWVSFENSEGITHVYDRKGNLLYEYVCEEGRKMNESGREFMQEVFYRQGMKIVFEYNDDANYYGIHYYNAETNKLIFELTDDMVNLPDTDWKDLQVTSMPDETGTAVVIAGDGFYNTVYYVTKDGYTEKRYIAEEEEHVERRFITYSVHTIWNRSNLVNGWLMATMSEERGEILDYSEESADVLYNIHTWEAVPLPEEYQNWYSKVYQYSAGLYYGMSGESYYDYGEGKTDYIYYAICHGSKILSEEIYQWINFGENYIIAGNNSFSHILDYEGNVLAEYKDVAYPFVDGRTLVCDETGAFYIDEELNRCSDYVLTGVDYCHPGYIRKGNKSYLVKIEKTEE